MTPATRLLGRGSELDKSRLISYLLSENALLPTGNPNVINCEHPCLKFGSVKQFQNQKKNIKILAKISPPSQHRLVEFSQNTTSILPKTSKGFLPPFAHGAIKAFEHQCEVPVET